MDKFIPVVNSRVDAIEDMFLRNNNSQVYLSAAAARYLGNPDYVMFLEAMDGSSIAIKGMEFDSETGGIVKVNKRPDSEASRLAGVPKSIMRKIPHRIDATKADNGIIVFDLEA